MLGVVLTLVVAAQHAADADRIRLNLVCPLILKDREAIVVNTRIDNRLSARFSTMATSGGSMD
jgi:hypothetical protein